MSNRIILATLAVVLGLMLVTVGFYGCSEKIREVEVIKEVPTGISQTDYDALLAELEQANDKITELEAELEKARVDLAPADKPEPEPEPPSEPIVLKEWSGNGEKTTEPFAIDSSPWIIAWSHNPTASFGGYLGITVYDASDRYAVSLVANTVEQGSDYSYIYETGTFYLEISAVNTSWAVKVFVAEN